MKIKEARALAPGTSVVITGDHYTGMIGSLVAVRQHDGIQRARVSFAWQPFMGLPKMNRAIWFRPAEIELASP